MRNRYLDLLRAVATVRVVVYHLTGWTALTVVFPAMSVMFALAGSMMAASLDRHGPFAVERRLRRLLPSLWVLAVIAVPAMMIGGMAWDSRLLLWAFPLVDPPAGGGWMQALSATWYLRDFLWLVLLSPIALPIFRRFPIPTLLIPYLGLAVVTLAGLHPHPVLHDLALYGGPWLLGFAHHDGLLRRRRLIGLAAVLAVAAGFWVVTHPGPRGYDLNDIPLGNALWSAAFVLVALRFAPKIRAYRLIAVLNARALTIYLWHVPIIVAVSQLALARTWPIFGAAGIGWRMPVVFALVACAVLLSGWVEDLAAGRRASFVPGIVGPTEQQDVRHDLHTGTGPAHVLRPRVREHAGRIPDLGREHDLPAGRGAEQLPGVRG